MASRMCNRTDHSVVLWRMLLAMGRLVLRQKLIYLTSLPRYKGKERRDGTGFGVERWQAVCAIAPTTQYFMTHAARHETPLLHAKRWSISPPFLGTKEKRWRDETGFGVETMASRDVQSHRPLSILWHMLLATVSRQMLFHLTFPFLSVEFMGGFWSILSLSSVWEWNRWIMTYSNSHRATWKSPWSRPIWSGTCFSRHPSSLPGRFTSLSKR